MADIPMPSSTRDTWRKFSAQARDTLKYFAALLRTSTSQSCKLNQNAPSSDTQQLVRESALCIFVSSARRDKQLVSGADLDLDFGHAHTWSIRGSFCQASGMSIIMASGRSRPDRTSSSSTACHSSSSSGSDLVCPTMRANLRGSACTERALRAGRAPTCVEAAAVALPLGHDGQQLETLNPTP